MTNIELSIKAGELTAAILQLAAAIAEKSAEPAAPSVPAPTTKEPEALPEPQPEPDAVETPVKLETVRATLAGKSQAGKQKEVKALIASYGVSKLTEISPAFFAELLQKAEQL